MKRTITDSELKERLLKPLDIIHNEVISESENAITSGFKETNNPTTLVKYISNPTGKGTAYVANRSAIKQGLNITYINLLREHRKSFYAIPYVYTNGDILYHIKVPSEMYKDNKISYDVLFLLKYEKNRDRKNRDMQVYSNSPSFIFTYCYVYNKHGMLIEKLKGKFPNEALTKAPDVRNPIQSFGYEKSTYIAARYLLDGRCLTDEYINRFSKTMTTLEESRLFNSIADPEVLVSIYQHAQYEKRKTHRKEISDGERKAKQEQRKKYIADQKRYTPKKSLLTYRTPRAKLTARQATKIVKDEYKKR